MEQITLKSKCHRSLKPLVQAAIENEVRLLEASISRSETRLRDFERRYGMSTEEFIERFENDELQETLDFIDWIGEYRLLQRLRDKAETLREITFAG
jgi:phage shock protein A